MSEQDKARYNRVFSLLVEETRAASGDGDGILIIRNYCPQKGDHDPSLKEIADYFEEWCKVHPILSKWPYNREDQYFMSKTLTSVCFWNGEETVTITTDKEGWKNNWGPDVKIEIW